MTDPPPGKWGGPPPPAPAPPPGPSGGGNRNLAVAIAGVVVVAVAAILAIVLISNSGGDSTAAGSSSPPVASVGPSLTASGVPPRSSSSSSAASSSSSTVPSGPLDCAGVSASSAFRPLATFTKGGALPSGVPLPQAVPAFTCAGTSRSDHVSLVAVSWKSITLAQYDAQLRGSGWTEQDAGPLKVYHRSGASKAIVLADVGTQLVAVYGPPK